RANDRGFLIPLGPLPYQSLGRASAMMMFKSPALDQKSAVSSARLHMIDVLVWGPRIVPSIRLLWRICRIECGVHPLQDISSDVTVWGIAIDGSRSRCRGRINH